jgi:predicted nuclease of predicted toxin-antitoxin system
VRFLVDECAGPNVAAWLVSLGHDVYSVFEESPGMSDDDVLSKAAFEERILITIDKDFGEMIFRERREHKGVILLRLTDERSSNKIAVLREILENYPERIPGQFVTATENKLRFS